jgi:hypothetical protein
MIGTPLRVQALLARGRRYPDRYHRPNHLSTAPS